MVLHVLRIPLNIFYFEQNPIEICFDRENFICALISTALLMNKLQTKLEKTTKRSKYEREIKTVLFSIHKYQIVIISIQLTKIVIFLFRE